MREIALSFVLVSAIAGAADLSPNQLEAADLSPNQLEKVMDNVSHEYTTCGAYFRVAAQVMENSGETISRNEYLEAAKIAFNYAIAAAKIGRSDETALKVVKARSEIEIGAMLDEIDDHAANVSLLNVKHAYRCQAAMQDIEAVIDDWSQKIKDRPQ